MRATLAVTGKGNEVGLLRVKYCFGLLKRDGKVYTKIISYVKLSTLMPVIQNKLKPNRIVYTDCWRGSCLSLSTVELTIQSSLHIA